MKGKENLERRLLYVLFILISKKPETSVATTEPRAQQTHRSLIYERYNYRQNRGAQALNAGSAGTDLLPDRSYCHQHI